MKINNKPVASFGEILMGTLGEFSPIYICTHLSLHLCASDKGKDACQGDSGGPLVYKENSRL